MLIASVLRRKRDEIAATIAAYEARIDAARMDLAALEQAARLFDSEGEGGGDETALRREFEGPGKPEDRPDPQRDVWESERPLVKGQSALPVARPRGSDDQDVEKPQFTGEVAYSATQTAGEQIPEEFFYLDWP